MEIAAASVESPSDRANWSGIAGHRVAERVRRGVDLHRAGTPQVDRIARRTNRLRRFGVLSSRKTLFF